jgi:hypothetical protein
LLATTDFKKRALDPQEAYRKPGAKSVNERVRFEGIDGRETGTVFGIRVVRAEKLTLKRGAISLRVLSAPGQASGDRPALTGLTLNLTPGSPAYTLEEAARGAVRLIAEIGNPGGRFRLVEVWTGEVRSAPLKITLRSVSRSAQRSH